jgi:hypothetical protein
MDIGSVVILPRDLTRKVANCLCREFAGINHVVVIAIEGDGFLSGGSSQPGRSSLYIQPLYSICISRFPEGQSDSQWHRFLEISLIY